ncbi:hypothetical protein JW930_02300 [Candidatus Woesearchaeota archaeon]|nr:hypothetical protein [Candidatus Woesearchaeota archaeon]
MVLDSISELFVKNLLLPKTYIIDKPGIVISESTGHFSRSKKRMLYCFEDTFVEMQKLTLEKIGFERTNKLYYNIGIAMGERLACLSNNKVRIPRQLLKQVIVKLFGIFSAYGVNRSEVIFQSDKIIIRGSETLICRKTGIGSFYAGITAALIGSLMKKEVYASKTKCCFNDSYCEIIIHIRSQSRKEEHSEFAPCQHYYQYNFPKHIKYVRHVHSIKELIEFKQLTFSKQKQVFMNHTIFPLEVGLFGIFYYYYEKESLLDVFEAALVKSGRNLLKSFYLGKDVSKMDAIEKIFSTLGNGVLFISCSSERAIVTCLYSPYSRYKPFFFAHLLQGFLDEATNRECVLRRIEFEPESTCYRFKYRLRAR